MSVGKDPTFNSVEKEKFDTHFMQLEGSDFIL
jgi:hypothetical protein